MRFDQSPPFRRLMAVCLIATSIWVPMQFVFAQINLPELGDADTEALTPAMERRLGERAVQEMRLSGEIDDDEETTEYLNLIGGELAAASATAAHEAGVAAADFSFFAVHDSTVNAFSLPGGFIGVNTGLITTTQTESELASVLGHEIGHVTQRHIARMIGRQKASMLAILGSLAAAILAARSNSSSAGDLAQAALLFGQAGVVQQQLAFSRDAEREADRVGFQTLVRAGFDPQGMVEFFERLQKASRLYETNAPAYMRTHPLTEERIADMQNRARAEHYRQHADRFDYLLIRARAQALADMSVNGLRGAQDAFQGRLAHSAAGHNLATAADYYGLAVAQLQLREFSQAAASAAQARARGDAHPFVAKLEAEVQVASGHAEAAVAALEVARKRWPNSGVLRTEYAQALQVGGRHAEVVSFLREQTSLYRGDAHLFELLAKSYAALGQQARSHLALAEAYRLKGSTASAVDQLEQAQKLARADSTPEDFMLASEVNSRLREARSQMQDELRERGAKGGSSDAQWRAGA